MAGVGGVEDHDAVLAVRGAFAREDAVLPVFRRHHVVDDAGVREHRIGDFGVRGIADVDRVHPVSDGREISARAGRMHPHFRRAELDRQVSPHFQAPRDPPLLDFHHRVCGARPGRGRDGVRPRQLGNERAIGVQVRSAGARFERPGEREPRNRPAARILRRRREAHDVAGADRRRPRIQRQARHGVGKDLNRKRPRRRPRLRGHRGAAGRYGAQHAFGRDTRHSSVARGERHGIVSNVVVRAVRGAVEREPRAHDELRGRW